MKRKVWVIILVLLAGLLVICYGGPVARTLTKGTGRNALDVWVTPTPLVPGERREVRFTIIPFLERKGPNGITREIDSLGKYRVEVTSTPELTFTPSTWEMDGAAQSDKVVAVEAAAGATDGERQVKVTATPQRGSGPASATATFRVIKKRK